MGLKSLLVINASSTLSIILHGVILQRTPSISLPFSKLRVPSHLQWFTIKDSSQKTELHDS